MAAPFGKVGLFRLLDSEIFGVRQTRRTSLFVRHGGTVVAVVPRSAMASNVDMDNTVRIVRLI